MKEKPLFEQLGETYFQVGDYLLPNLTLPEQPKVGLGVYAQMRKSYLLRHHKVIYYNYLTSGMLVQHLAETEQRALKMEDRLIRQMAQREGVTEQLKAENQMLWVRKMNNICCRAREVVLTEIIYQ